MGHRVPRDVIDAIREHTDIVAVVSKHVQLKRRSSTWVGLCPFHQEKTPSFHVVPAKGIFHCFGCGEGGDAIAFLRRIEGLSFIEAVKELAGPAGIVVPEADLLPEERAALRRRATLYEVLEAATQFYERTLWASAEGSVARTYLANRGLREDTARLGRLGWAPDQWTSLLDHLHREGLDPALAEAAGLCRPGKQQGHYDTFRARVIFPIFDTRGRPIGMGGRILEGDGPKYLNTPETTLYEKSKVLYGLHRAGQAIRTKDQVLLVEGYFDVLSLWQAGFDEAVAACGTALTPEHLQRLRPLARKVLMTTDSDEAGERAAEKSLPMFLDAGMVPLRVSIPGAKDPDELLQRSGPQAMAEAIEAAEPLAEWVVNRRLAGAAGMMGEAAVFEELLPLLLKLPPAALSHVASRLGRESVVLQKVEAARRAQPKEASAATAPPEPGWRPTRDVVHLLWLLVHRYDQVADLLARVDHVVLVGQPILRAAVARLVQGEPVSNVIEEEADPSVARTLLAVVSKEESLYEPAVAADALCDLLARLTRDRRLAYARALAAGVERVRDDGELKALVTARKEEDERKKSLDASRKTGDLLTFVETLNQSLRALESTGAASGVGVHRPVRVNAEIVGSARVPSQEE